MSVESRLKFQSPETSPAKQLSHKQAKWIGTSFKMCKKQLKKKKKNTKRILHTAHVAWSKPRSSKIPNWFEKMLFTPFFLEAEIFTLAAKLKALACTPSEVVTQASVSTVRGNNIFFFFLKIHLKLGSCWTSWRNHFYVSENVLWTKKLHPTFRTEHGAEQLMTESFLFVVGFVL